MKLYFYVQAAIIASLFAGLSAAPTISQAEIIITPLTFAKLVDSSDQVPDRPAGTLFQLFGAPALDGNRVVFNVSTPSEYAYSIWSIDALTGLPSLVRLVDTNTPIPQGTGNFTERFSGNPFTSPKVEGGKVVFGGAGTNPENTGKNQSGFYSVPTGGGAIGMLVNSAATMPGVTPVAKFDIQVGSSPFNLDANSLVFGGDRIFGAPVNGGPVANLGAGFLCTNGYGFPFGVNSYYSPDVSGSTMSMRMSNMLGLPAIVIGPLTGVTGADKCPNDSPFVKGGTFQANATFIATLNDTLPGDPNNRKFTDFYPPLIDGNTVVFLGYSGSDFTGFYSSIPDQSGKRQLRKLADTNTAVPGGTGTFKTFVTYDYYSPSSHSLSVDTLVFIGRDAADKDGIYQVSTTGDALSKIIATGDSLGDGRTVLGVSGSAHLNDYSLGTDSLKEKRLAFRVFYSDTVAKTQGSAIYLANLSASDPKTCLFNWAETAYPGLLSPAGAIAQIAPPYAYRYYRDTNAYVGVSSENNHVYYLEFAQ